MFCFLQAAADRRVNDPSHLSVPRRAVGQRVCDWPVDDVDDAVGCGQVGLDDGVHSAGVAHQDELLNKHTTSGGL